MMRYTWAVAPAVLLSAELPPSAQDLEDDETTSAKKQKAAEKKLREGARHRSQKPLSRRRPSGPQPRERRQLQRSRAPGLASEHTTTVLQAL